MGIFTGCIKPEEIDLEIEDLKRSRSSLKKNIDNLVEDSFVKKYPEKDYKSYLNSDVILVLKESIEKKYLGKIDFKIRQLYLLKKDVV